jgi:hypothetical protein
MIALRRRRRTLLTAAWWGSALMAAIALIGLMVITGAPRTSGLALRASTGTYNQMTGIGTTASAVTVPWTSGLLDSSNQPLTSATPGTDGGAELNPNSDRAAGTGPLSFMDSDFANLSVTVSQTENITEQGITVSWSGAQPSVGGPNYDFMQIMECYGDSASGPSPEGCEYGSPGMLDPSANTEIPNPEIEQRTGFTCAASSAPNTTAPPSGPDAGPAQGCDPYEPAAETPAHCDPSATGDASCSGGQFSIPFVPADDTSNPLYGAGSTGTGTGTLFNEYDSNEVQAAYTAADGTGQQQFETLTQIQAPGLGCGETESSGQTRDCWLVIVPRGSYEPNGFKANPSVPLQTSPLSASNWAQRIQVHLGYAPLSPDCPPTVIPQAMVGTQVAYRAVSSWETALNQAANCSSVYSYTASTESESTTQLQNPGNGSAGLAFTTIPIGSEVTEEDPSATPPTLPTILYAPVAVTAIGFGFNINTETTGQLTTPVNLTPSLLAKAVTQVYSHDLPDGVASTASIVPPTWVANNPQSLFSDPAFTALNPEIPLTVNGDPTFPLITGDHSADIQRIWEWIQSDPATASWLDGGTDPNNPVTADPDYVPLNLGKSPAANQFDEAYTGTITCGEEYAATVNTSCIDSNAGVNATDTSLDSEDLLPVETNFDEAAAAVLAADDPANTRIFSFNNKSASGNPGWWGTVGIEQAGGTFMWAVNDMPDLAAYGLISAALCPASVTAATAATACVQPSTASVTAALNSATTDSAGLLQVNPATVPSGAYPLVDVVYAAVPTDQSASALTAYANFIAYAAGQGQTAGTAPGNLPPGYLPLTDAPQATALQAQDQSVVAQLQALASPSASPSPSPTTSSPSASPTTSTTSTTTGDTSTGSTTTGDTSTGSTTTGDTTTGSTTTGSTTTGSTTTGSTTTGSTTTGGTTSGSTSTAGTASGSTTAKGAATTGSQTSAAPSASAHATQSAAASSSPTPTVAFNVAAPSAQAAAGTTPGTTVGSVRGVLIIVLIIGAAGALAGGLLRYGRLPGYVPVPGRSRQRTDTS